MKFVSAKKPTDHANELRVIKRKLRKLRQQGLALKAEQKALEDFLYKVTKGEDFQFNGEDGYLQQLEWQERERSDVNDEAVRRFYQQHGKKVPLKKVTWITTRITHVGDAGDSE
jgi:hypothetical protein